MYSAFHKYTPPKLIIKISITQKWRDAYPITTFIYNKLAKYVESLTRAFSLHTNLR